MPALRQHLSERLPDFMQPSTYVALDALPLTPSGKVDRKALPAPDGLQLAPAHTFVAPRNPTEELLAGVFAQVLRLGQVGVHDSFFDLGGHSLLATQVISRLRAAFH
ncbi:phosphopantetheine-binding protein, partial [Arthrospira platensis SPKY1]|nr:phosphopantetheine-binding protein [Arthrospira platensis SPKY1]